MNRVFGPVFLAALFLAAAAGLAPGVTHAQQPAPPSQRPAGPATLPAMAPQRPSAGPALPGIGVSPVIAGVSFSATLSFQEAGARAPEPEVILLEGRFNATGELALRFEVMDENRRPETTIEMVQVGGRLYLRADDEEWYYLDSDDLMDDASGPQCSENLSELPGIVTNPLAALRSVGAVEVVGTQRLDGATVVHVSGTLDLDRVLDALFRYLATDPACAELLAEEDLNDLTADVIGDSAPTIQYDIFVRESDGFPYRLVLVVGIPDEGELTLQIDARPSTTPFAIVAPADARPFPTGEVELALPGR